MTAVTIPDPMHWRIVFRLGPTDDRAWFWFRMDGDDLYWGPSGGGKDHAPIPFAGPAAEIAVPNDLHNLVTADVKASWHASGRAHVKNSRRPDERTGSMRGATSLITVPVPIAAVFTKAPCEYEPYRRSLTRGGASALVVRVPPDRQHVRHYAEFYLASPGQHPRPPSIVNLHEQPTDQSVTMSLSMNLILVMRLNPLGGTLATWRADTQIWLHLDPTERKSH